MKQIDQFVSLDFTEHNSSGEAQKKAQSCLSFSWLSPKVLSVFTFDYMAQRKQGHISLQEEKNHRYYHSLHHHPYLGFTALSGSVLSSALNHPIMPGK